MYFKESMKSSLKSLVNNKLRSLLTMLGIIIGISSVIMISTIGKGTKESILKDLNEISKNLISIHIEAQPDQALLSKHLFNDSDLELIQNIEGVSAISRLTTFWIRTRLDRRSIWMQVQVANNQLADVIDVNMLHGRNYTKEEDKLGKRVVVIDDMLAEKYFGRVDVVGEEITLEYYGGIEHKFLVVGVYENLMKKANELFSSEQFMILMPKNTGIKYFYANPVNYMSIRVDDIQKKPMIEKQVINILEGQKKAKGIYKIDTGMAKELGMVNNVLNIVSLFISSVAAISLFVGGIGVMNIMLVTVTERTREIGIRKSLGAKRRDVLMQFLVEAIILTGIGGIIGLSLGYFGAIGIGKFIKITPLLSPNMVIMAISVSSLVGIIFGVFPANKASKLNPIEALRHE